MQNLFQQSLQIPQMRRFHGVFYKDSIFSLTKTRCISCTRFISSNSSQKHRLFRHFLFPDPRTIHSTSRFSYEEQTNPDFERPRVWTGSDSWAGEFVPSYADLRNSLQEEKSSSEDETPKFSSGSATGTGAEKFTAKTAGQRETKLEQEEPGSKDRNPRSENYGVSSGPDSKAQWFASKKKMSKSKIHWVCNNCGESFGQWWGSCRHCGEMNTLKQFVETEKAENKARGSDVSEKIVRSWLPQRPGELRPQRLTEINKGINQMAWRIPLSGLFGAEVSRVLGGGVVPGSLVLVGGDPGVGKSTLLLQVAAMLAEGSNTAEPAPVIYVSGEESVEQIGNRADRMRVGTDELFLYSSTDIEDILEKIQVLSPRALVVDSIQTVYLKSALGSAGSITQVKECTSALLHFAKQTKIPVFLIGHVTKTGDIAGPRVLEHIVDAVLYMEGERYSSHRLLRSVKNRFGSTDELGVFEMSELGLQAVSNPSEIFLTESYSGSEVLAGLAVAVIIDGSRSFLIEIQALCSSSSTIGRHFNGVPANRAEMIIAVLVKQAGLKLQDNAIFLNVVSGFMLKETAGDLAIAAAICSSFLEFPIPNDVAFIGEVGLGGELRTVPRLEKRVAALSKLGYRKCIIPTAAEKSLKARDMGTLAIIGCRNLKEVINKVFVVE